MSNVVKSKQKKTRFEADHNMIKLRDEVTKLCVNDFGFKLEKAQERRNHFYNTHRNLENIDEIMERYDKKLDSFDKWFIDEESHAILSILRELTKEFTLGNSIYPNNGISKLFEYLERRKHMTRAIGLCYTLQHEIQYVIRILPVDKNKYKRFSEMIEKQVALIKGVRKADNRFLKDVKNKEEDMISRIAEMFSEIED